MRKIVFVAVRCMMLVVAVGLHCSFSLWSDIVNYQRYIPHYINNALISIVGFINSKGILCHPHHHHHDAKTAEVCCDDSP